MGHAQYEWIYIAAVVALLIWVGASSWDVERIIEEVPADAETIKVTGQQWFWSFEHADGTKEVNELHVEQDKPYRFEMTSLDVNHNFNVPDWTILMDVIPGRINTLWNMFDQPGEYLIQCREYCGFSHYNMKAKLFVEPPTTTTPVADESETGSTTSTGAVTTPTVPSTKTTPGNEQRAAVGTQPGEESAAPGTPLNANTTSGAGGGAGSTQQGQQGQTAGVTLTILEGSSIQGNPDFDPDELKAKKGDKILVKNADTMPHTVTNGKSSTDPNSAKIFDTSIINGGDSAEIDTSNIDAGTNPFYCMVHPYMTGSLIIETQTAGGDSAAPGASGNTTSFASGATTTATAGAGSTQQGQQGQQTAGVTLTILEGSSIQGNPDFDPDELKAKKGDKILVKNADTMPHTVTNGKSSTDPNSAKIFDTSIINGGDSAEIDTSTVDAGAHPF